MANIWYPVKIKKDLEKINRFKNCSKLYVKVNSNDELDLVTFTIWNGGTDTKTDFEHLDIHEAIDHLESIRDKDGKNIMIKNEALDMEWFKCIHPEWKYRNR